MPLTTMDTKTINYITNPSQLLHFLSLQYLHKTRRSFFALLSLLVILLLAYNVVSIFCIHVPFPSGTPTEHRNFSPERVAGNSEKWLSSPTKLSSSANALMYAVKEENPSSIQKTNLPLLQESTNFATSINSSSIYTPKRGRKQKPIIGIVQYKDQAEQFSTRVEQFFSSNLCKVRFFMTWISSVESFGDRELFVIESLFKSHPNGCLIIVSNPMDSTSGIQILRPFLDKGFQVTSISPDYDYLLKNTIAEAWFNQLKKGNVDPGEISIGQNLSNLIRLALLYKFGGVYIDTDVIILKSLANLRNSIGAQTMDHETKNWTRLNNAVLIFDKGHPLVYKFIEEFALTFNGNKWGHNGPYLVSRVVSRLDGSEGFNFSVLPPMAFYPVDWSNIHKLFVGPRDEIHSKWLNVKLRQIRNESFALHLWNRQSKNLKIEQGSIIGSLMADCCVLCNSSVSSSL